MTKQSGADLLFTFRVELGALRTETRTGLANLASALDRRFEKVEGAMEAIIDAYGEELARIDRVEADVEDHEQRLEALESKKH